MMLFACNILGTKEEVEKHYITIDASNFSDDKYTEVDIYAVNKNSVDTILIYQWDSGDVFEDKIFYPETLNDVFDVIIIGQKDGKIITAQAVEINELAPNQINEVTNLSWLIDTTDIDTTDIDTTVIDTTDIDTTVIDTTDIDTTDIDTTVIDTTTFIDPTLVAYYPFNGNAIDETGNENDGVVNGAVLTTDRSENENSAYDFNGDPVNSINLFQIPEFTKPIQGFSISLWINVQAFNDGYQFLISNSWEQTGFALTIGIKRLTFETGGNGALISSDDIDINTWYNVTVVYSDERSKMYLDATLVGSVVNDVNLIANDREMVIGNWLGGYNFNGIIDDIRIYNRGLSASEVDSLYQLSD